MSANKAQKLLNLKRREGSLPIKSITNFRGSSLQVYPELKRLSSTGSPKQSGHSESSDYPRSLSVQVAISGLTIRYPNIDPAKEPNPSRILAEGGVHSPEVVPEALLAY